MSSTVQTFAPNEATAMRAGVALLRVSNVERSIEFYRKLGFELGGERTNDQGTRTFAWTHRGQSAQIMFTLAGRPLNPGARGVMFYLYVENLTAYREVVMARGVKVGELEFPFWSPQGEFRIDDPDGWTWQIC